MHRHSSQVISFESSRVVHSMSKNVLHCGLSTVKLIVAYKVSTSNLAVVQFFWVESIAQTPLVRFNTELPFDIIITLNNEAAHMFPPDNFRMILVSDQRLSFLVCRITQKMCLPIAINSSTSKTIWLCNNITAIDWAKASKLVSGQVFSPR